MRRTRVLTLALVLLLASGAVALAVDGADVDWHVLGGGGGSAESGTVSLGATIGQPLAGLATGGDRTLCAGFWCLPTGGAGFPLRLPLVMRDHRS